MYKKKENEVKEVKINAGLGLGSVIKIELTERVEEEETKEIKKGSNIVVEEGLKITDEVYFRTRKVNETEDKK